MTKNYRIVWLVLSFELSKFNFFWVQNVWNSYAKSTYISVLNSIPGLGTKHLFGGQQTRDEAKAPMHRRHALLGFFLVFFPFRIALILTSTYYYVLRFLEHCLYAWEDILVEINFFNLLQTSNEQQYQWLYCPL